MMKSDQFRILVKCNNCNIDSDEISFGQLIMNQSFHCCHISAKRELTPSSDYLKSKFDILFSKSSTSIFLKLFL